MTKKEKKFILQFEEVALKDIPLVGGKNAALGEMVSNLVPMGIRVPGGFAVTSHAYNYFLESSNLRKKIEDELSNLNTHNLGQLKRKGLRVRSLILKASLPKELEREILKAYEQMGKKYKKKISVAVRSSATAEDLPGASFAGQQETYLNVSGKEDLLLSVKKCFASLFTDRAISYRVDKGFSHMDVSLSVGIQKMVRSDLASSGVAFTIDTETGFDKVVIINSSWGLGEMVVQGKVTPDEFMVFKPALKQGYDSIIAKDVGEKDKKMVYARGGVKTIDVTLKEQNKYSLSDYEIVLLSRWCVKIEEYFSKKHKRYQPMDIEWAKDGKTGELFIVQARPETVHSAETKKYYEEYKLKKKSEELIVGTAIGTKITTGRIHVIKDVKNMMQFKKGEVLVTGITDPDWEPIMKIASAIVTDKGGRTSHAAIVARELGIPAIVGTGNATSVLKDGQNVTIDSSSGKKGIVYEGKLYFEIIRHELNKIPKTKTTVMVNIGAPEEAFSNSALPVHGVGLGRLEFIINSYLQIHPKALIDFLKLKRSKKPEIKKIVSKIEKHTIGYKDKTEFYINELAEGVAKIAAAFWPYDVIIRFSDFKTNEYRALIGGELYEPEEQNPMLGWRGASRYSSAEFSDAFRLEVLALKKAREVMGLKNIIPMVPFCRTPQEGKKVVELIAKYGLDRRKDKSLKIYVMCEIPSNVILADDFLKIFNGMSIGSNDLTQLVLGLDRDSAIVNKIANETNEAVLEMIREVIRKCRKKRKYVGICGQAPSDYPKFTEFLIKEGISSISLNPDVVIPMLKTISKTEKKLKK